MKNVSLFTILCLIISCTSITTRTEQTRKNASTNDSEICDNSISAIQLKNELVSSLTSIEVRVDEVESLKINSINVQSENERKLVALSYTLALRERSHLSKTIALNDFERKKMQITVNLNVPCKSRGTSSSAILIDGRLYNDVPDDDRDGLAEFNQTNANSLQY